MSQESGKKLITKKSATEWMQNNFLAIVVIIGVLVVGFVCAALFFEWQRAQEKKIHGNLYEMQRSLDAAAIKANGEDYKKMQSNPYAFLLKNKDKEFVYSDEMKASAQSYESVLKNYQNKKAGVSFAIKLANFYYMHGQKEQARNLLVSFAQAKKRNVIYHLSAFQLANYYMNDKECDKAISLWNDLIKNKKAKHLHKEAYKQSAICYEYQKNYIAARKAYEEILNKYPNDLDTQPVKKYIHLLNLKQKLETK